MKKWMLSISLLLFLVPGKSQDEENRPYSKDCEFAEFPGGTKGLLKFLRKNICYPEAAVKDSVQGKVYIRFLIDTSGTIRNVKISESVRKDIDSACLEGIKRMPRWKPLLCLGKREKTWYVLPVNFKLTYHYEEESITITPFTCDEWEKKRHK